MLRGVVATPYLGLVRLGELDQILNQLAGELLPDQLSNVVGRPRHLLGAGLHHDSTREGRRRRMRGVGRGRRNIRHNQNLADIHLPYRANSGDNLCTSHTDLVDEGPRILFWQPTSQGKQGGRDPREFPLSIYIPLFSEPRISQFLRRHVSQISLFSESWISQFLRRHGSQISLSLHSVFLLLRHSF